MNLAMEKPTGSVPLLFLVLAMVCPAWAAETASNAIIGSWLNAQTNLHSWSADVIQIRSLQSLTAPLTATGHVWFVAPNRFRWEIKQPGETIAVRAPTELLVIYPRLKRVERYPLNGDKAGPWRDALALLEAGFPRSRTQLEAQYEIISQRLTNSTCEVTLRPRSTAAAKMIPRVKIYFSTRALLLLATELEFADGSLMRNEFTNPVLNPPIAEDLFNPPIPSGYKESEPLKSR